MNLDVSFAREIVKVIVN